MEKAALPRSRGILLQCHTQLVCLIVCQATRPRSNLVALGLWMETILKTTSFTYTSQIRGSSMKVIPLLGASGFI